MTDEQLRKAFEIAHHKFNGITPRWINIRRCYAYSTHQYCFEWFKRGAEAEAAKPAFSASAATMPGTFEHAWREHKT